VWSDSLYIEAGEAGRGLEGQRLILRGQHGALAARLVVRSALRSARLAAH